jgi:hypothetical protein
VPFIGD